MRTSTRRRAIGAILVLVSLLMVTCDDFSLSDSFYSETGLPLAIFPSTVATWASGELEFVGQGGAPDYTFSVEDADGGTIDPETGRYTAPPFAGEYTVTVTDRAGASRPAIVFVVEERPLRIWPRSASVAVGETKGFAATGGEGVYEFSVPPADPVVGTVDAISGVFTAVAAGTTNVKVEDGTSTVAASVFVYVGTADDLQIIIDEPEIEQRAPTGLRVIMGTDTTGISLAGQSLALEVPGDLGFTSGLGHPDWDGQFVAGDSIGTIELTAEDTDSGDTSSVIVTVLPATPTNLVADNDTGSPSSIRLTWDHSAPLPDTDSGFRIYRSSSASPAMTLVDDVGPDAREYLDGGVSPSVSYYIYEVEAFTLTPAYTSRRSEPSAPTTSKP